MSGCELPRIIVQWSFEGDPIVILDVLDLHGECQLLDHLLAHRADLPRVFEETIAAMQARCKQAAERDLGRRRRAA